MNLECCTPFKVPTPVGLRWCHSRWCLLPSMRNQIVRTHTTHPAGTGLDQVEPYENESPLQTWFRHDHDLDGTPMCWNCAYVEHHKDDNDDRTDDRTLEGRRR